MAHLTATEQRIYDLLSDCEYHSATELHSCLEDELGDMNNLQAHISNIRRKIKRRGEVIVSSTETVGGRKNRTKYRLTDSKVYNDSIV